MIPPEDEDPTLKYQIRFINVGDYLLRHLTEAFLKARQDLPSLMHLHCLEKKKVAERGQKITALQAHIANQEQQIEELRKTRNQTPHRRHRNEFPYPPRRRSLSGHRRHNPRLNNNLFAPVTCHGCGEFGHIVKRCPNKQPTVAYCRGKRHLWDHWNPFNGWRARGCGKSGIERSTRGGIIQVCAASDA